MFFGGIEGGATETVMALLSASGEILSRSSSTGTNMWTIGETETVRTLVLLVQDCASKANVALPLDCLGMALSGMDHKPDQERLISLLKPHNLAHRITVCTDVVGSIFTASSKGNFFFFFFFFKLL
jgi:N-acetylglucosamine kinase-like BadF-type ATPase